jgi:hypothetical protein
MGGGDCVPCLSRDARMKKHADGNLRRLSVWLAVWLESRAWVNPQPLSVCLAAVQAHVGAPTLCPAVVIERLRG